MNNLVAIILLPVLSWSLSSMDSSFSIYNLKWPKYGNLTLIASLGLLIGVILNMAFMDDPWIICVGVFMAIESAICWTLPTLVTQIFLENLTPSPPDHEKSLIGASMKFIDNFEKLERSLRGYFLMLFTPSQIIIIVQFFNGFWVSQAEYIPPSVARMSLTVTLMTALSWVVNMVAITSSVDETEDRLRGIKKALEARLLKTRDEEEIKELEYCKNMADLLRPMNAAGYFEIDKTTLTSMLSVR